MKILIVLALLFSLSSAYVSFMHSVHANGTQVPNGYGNTGAGYCDFSDSYDSVTNTYSGTFTCSGILNVTAAHVHSCDSITQFDYVYQKPYLYNCPVLDECKITTTATGGSWSCVFTNSSFMDAICNDQCYFNVHTDPYYFSNGEVRGNLVSMAPICNVATGVKLDGVAVVGGVAPDSGIQVPPFYYGSFLNPADAASTGNCFYIASFQPLYSVLIISGCCWGLPDDVYSVEAFQASDNYQTDFYSSYSLSIQNDLPFSLRFPWMPTKLL